MSRLQAPLSTCGITVLVSSSAEPELVRGTKLIVENGAAPDSHLQRGSEDEEQRKEGERSPRQVEEHQLIPGGRADCASE